MLFWEIFGFGLDYFMATCGFILFLHFFKKILQIRETSTDLYPFFGLISSFLAISTYYIVVSWYDYFYWEFAFDLILLFKLSNILALFSIGSLMFICEYILKKTRFLFTAYIGIGTVIQMFLPSYDLTNLVFLIIVFPVLFCAIFIWYLVFIKPTSGFMRRRMLLSLFGLISFEIGSLLRVRAINDLLGNHMYSIGTILAIIGVSLIGYALTVFSSFTDIRWKEKLREIFVVSDDGNCLYAFSFEQSIPLDDSAIIASGFSGIQEMLSEMAQTSESIKLIEYQDVKIMVEQGESIIIVLIANEESSFLQYKLEIFAKEFHNFFKDIIEHKTEEIGLYGPTRTIIQRIFELAP